MTAYQGTQQLLAQERMTTPAGHVKVCGLNLFLSTSFPPHVRYKVYTYIYILVVRKESISTNKHAKKSFCTIRWANENQRKETQFQVIVLPSSWPILASGFTHVNVSPTPAFEPNISLRKTNHVHIYICILCIFVLYTPEKYVEITFI